MSLLVKELASPVAFGAAVTSVRIALLGVGHVGRAVLRVAHAERDRLRAAGLEVTFVGGLVRDVARHRDGDSASISLTTNVSALLESKPDVVVEVLGGAEPARSMIAAALARGVPVVTANKTVIARHGAELAALARRHKTLLAFEAAVIAGVPFVGALAHRPLLARATRLAGILNGTSNFVLTEIARGASRAAALDSAVARGYAEPNADADTSGRDAAEKLAILLRLTGHDGRPDELPRRGIDDIDRTDFALAAAVGGILKPVAMAEFSPEPAAWVGPAFVFAEHAFAQVNGSTNTLEFTGPDGATVAFTGPGAGPEATAATMLDDVVEVVGAGRRRSNQAVQGRPFTPSAPSGPWFVTLEGSSLPPNDLAGYLWQRGLPARRVESVGTSAVALTWPASAETVRLAIHPLRALGLRSLALPVIGAGTHG